MTGPDELREAKLEKNLSALFTTETRSTRRCTENPDASVKSPCPPCLRGETGHVAAEGLLPEAQRIVGGGQEGRICLFDLRRLLRSVHPVHPVILSMKLFCLNTVH